MNGGMTECNTCGWDPCICKQIAERKQKQRVKDGKVVLESLHHVMVNLPSWRMKIVKLIWPGFARVECEFLTYYQENAE